ncbi:RanBP1 domain-containing protein [Histoplasma ohiense]|nr:RanBP1 domain-containing protein [Histoplasma ohiense (nom. inval.)]
MSKRVAQAQGGKDLAGGFGNEMSANPTDMPKRATAAQLASRKIKQARQRTRIASPNLPSSTSQSFTSPFSTIDPNIVPPSSSTGTNGFNFGQAQSFPQPGSGTGTTPQTSFFGDQNNSVPKFFGSQAGSAPSSFSFTPSTTQEIKNPFADMPSGFGQSQSSTGVFQGFQGKTFNIPGTTSQGDQNEAGQQAPSAGIFGASQPPQQTLFAFGGSSAPASSSLFSATPPASTPPITSAPLFSQSTASNIFAPSTPSTNMFGSSPQTNKPSDEMQMSPPGKTDSINENKASQFFASGVSQPSFTSSATQRSPFGTPAPPSTSQPFSSPIFNTTPSGGSMLFGTMKKPDETSQPATSSITQPSPKFSFTPSIMSGSSIFSQPSKPGNDTPNTVTATVSTPSFSTSFSAPAPAPFSLFGTSSQPNELPAPSTTEDRPSSAKSPSAEPTKPTTVTGTSVFGHIAKPTEQPPAISASAAEDEKSSAEAPSPAQPATPSTTPFPSTPSGGGSLFGRTNKPGETSQPSSIFNTPATSTTPSGPVFSFTPSSTNVFQTPSKIPSAISNEVKTKESGPFQTKATGDTAPSSTSKLFTSLSQSQQPSSNSFGFTPASSPFKSTVVPEKTPSTPHAISASLPGKSTPTTTPKSSFAGISNGEGGLSKSTDTPPAKVESVMKRKESLTSKSRLASYGPPAIPQELNNDERAAFDTEWRLNALNTSFQRRVAEADPKSDDIEVLVEFYVKVRENIGVPTGLAMLHKSGKKQKEVEEDGCVVEDSSRNKRAKGRLPETNTTSLFSSPAAVDASNSSGDKSASASVNFSSTASSFGKRRMTDVEDESSSRGELGNSNGKRLKPIGDSATSASPLQKSSTDTEQKKRKSDSEGTGSGSGISAASDTVTMFATSFVSQSNRAKSPVGFTAPFSSLSSTKNGTEDPGTVSLSSQGSESENDTESNDSAEEDGGEGEGEGESETSLTPPATSNGGRSLFDRVELDQSGKPVRQEVPEIETVATPSSGEKDSNSNVSSLFAGSKFASSFNSPGSIGTPQFSNGFDFRSPGSLSPINPSPGGASDAKSPPAISASSTSTSAPTTSAIPTTTSSLFPKATSSLLPNGSAQLSPFPLSSVTSADVSRATTPNLSEAGADEPEEAAEDLPQVNLLRGGTGEEDEDEVFETRVKALKLGVDPASEDPKPKLQWILQGVGLLRILKHKTTGRARILVRADPSGRVLLNANLVAAVSYKSTGSAVQFLVPQEPKPEQWIARVKKEEIAVELAGVMEKNKK